MELVYKHEKALLAVSVVIGALVWLALVAATFGTVLIYVLLFFLIYLFVQSGFIAHLKGNAIELTEQQFPDLYAQYRDACARLNIETIPTAYMMMSDGVLNALATRFLRRHYVVIYSSVVEALRSRPEALRFYFGHELAHIKRGHLSLLWLKMPSSILPIVGAAYRRAQEYTCDLHGLAASQSKDDALAALAVLGTGGEKLSQLNLQSFIDQQRHSGGFWMSYHELTNDYPWLCKRLAHVAAAGSGSSDSRAAPSRNLFAWLFAAFTPRIGAVGGGASVLIVIVMIGVLAAIAVPAYQDYTLRSQVAAAMPIVDGVEQAARAYVDQHGTYPADLAELGIPESFESGPVESIALTEEGVELTLRSENARLDRQTIVVGAYREADDSIVWHCAGGTLPSKYRPPRCRSE